MVWSGPGDAFLLSWSYRSTFDAGREPGDGKSGPGPQTTVFGAQGTLRTQRDRRMKQLFLWSAHGFRRGRTNANYHKKVKIVARGNISGELVRNSTFSCSRRRLPKNTMKINAF